MGAAARSARSAGEAVKASVTGSVRIGGTGPRPEVTHRLDLMLRAQYNVMLYFRGRR